MAEPAENSLEVGEGAFSISVNASDNPAAKRLLDVIVSILSVEYIRKAKENPDIFSTSGGLDESRNLR